MTPNNLEQQLIKYLTDIHSIEHQALAQLKSAPKIAGDHEIAEAFNLHYAETEEQERLVRERLQALGAGPSAVKDLVGAVTGKGFVLFARSQPDTPGKLAAHAYSYEHMEEAAYDLLLQVAQQAGDQASVELAQRIGDQERAMAERLEALFDRAAEASLRDTPSLSDQLDKYLADAHAIEAQALELLEKGPKLAGSESLASAYEEHHAETERHQQLIAERLEARGASRSKLKDAVQRLGALNWGAFFQAQPDTPAKLAAFCYAFEHLEIAGYELLRRVATRAGDEETVAAVTRILHEEHAAAELVHSLFPQALDASLHAQGVGAR